MQPGAGEPVAHPVFGAVRVEECLYLVGGDHIAPATGQAGEHPGSDAVVGGGGDRGGDHRESDRVFAGKRCGQPLEAMGVEERGVGVAGQECRVPYNVDQ